MCFYARRLGWGYFFLFFPGITHLLVGDGLGWLNTFWGSNLGRTRKKNACRFGNKHLFMFFFSCTMDSGGIPNTAAIDFSM